MKFVHGACIPIQKLFQIEIWEFYKLNNLFAIMFREFNFINFWNRTMLNPYILMVEMWIYMTEIF